MAHFNYSYQKINIPITSVITDRVYEIAGQRITHNEGSKKISIKLESNTNDSIDIQPQGALIIPGGFTKFFISSEASPGGVTELVVSSPSDIELDNKALTVDTVDEITNIVNVELIETIEEVDSVVNVENIELVEAVTVNKLLERDITDYYDTLNSENNFSGGAVSPGTVSLYSTVQLRNPSASGINLIVKSIIHANQTDESAVYLNVYNSPLSNAINGVNNFLTKSVSVASIYHDVTGSILGSNIKITPTIKLVPLDLLFKKSVLIIPPGAAIITTALDIDKSNYTSFIWEEIPI